MFGATWSSWLGSEGRLQLVAASDVGQFARFAFDDPQKWCYKSISLAGDEKTLNELDFEFMRQFGHGMPRTWGFIGGAMTSYYSKEMGVSQKSIQ